MTAPDTNVPLLFGADPSPGLVAVEVVPSATPPDQVVLFFRQGTELATQTEPFTAFLLLEREDQLDQDMPRVAVQALRGRGRFRCRVDFPSWKSCQQAVGRLTRASGCTPSHPDAPFCFVNDPIQQHLTLSGRTLFKGLDFDELRRLQVDIECLTAEGFEFPNPERAEDRIIAIALGDNTGWRTVLSGAEMSERDLLEQFVALVRERDPDVIEGHNIFNFDLPYLMARAAQHGVRLALGRDGSPPATRSGRFTVAERTIAYTRSDIFGRHVVDTLFLVHAYDVSHRSLEGHGLKEVARHFGIAAPERTYLEGHTISAEFRRDPDRVRRYAEQDVIETEALSRLLAPSAFVQCRMVPFSYQNVCVRGPAAKIDALLLREYLRQGVAVPAPDKPRPFAGGYTEMFIQGVVRNVHHCDVRSLYPSLMLSRRIGPRSDELGVFHQLLEHLRAYRLMAKQALQTAVSAAERRHWDALQTAFKVLINSFYGYLGFEQARFNDFEAAERVTAEGRTLLEGMLDWLRQHGAQPVEADTDGIYFVPPPFATPEAAERFRAEFAAALPEGIEVEFDGEYPAMFSYKRKNYALLNADGSVIIKGAALKSRGLEPFQRAFLLELIRLKLLGQEARLPELKAQYRAAIEERRWPITMLAKTETLQDAPATYAEKVGRQSRGRNAAYELALRSGRNYRAGDQISYYVTGTRKNVPVHEYAKRVSDWDPEHRDENVAYYVAKLEKLYEKFCRGQLGEDSAAERAAPAEH